MAIVLLRLPRWRLVYNVLMDSSIEICSSRPNALCSQAPSCIALLFKCHLSIFASIATVVGRSSLWEPPISLDIRDGYHSTCVGYHWCGHRYLFETRFAFNISDLCRISLSYIWYRRLRRVSLICFGCQRFASDIIDLPWMSTTRVGYHWVALDISDPDLFVRPQCSQAPSILHCSSSAIWAPLHVWLFCRIGLMALICVRYHRLVSDIIELRLTSATLVGYHWFPKP